MNLHSTFTVANWSPFFIDLGDTASGKAFRCAALARIANLSH
ncbi:hypothetical protein ACOJUY_004233 [Vibrio alginolyticus]